MVPIGTIVIPTGGVTRNNATTGASTLDLGTLAAGNLDTVVRAGAGGVAGNSLTIEATGDSGAGDGVTIDVDGSAVTVHYEDGVSTVADVEAAIDALTTSTEGGLIAVDVPGTGATVLNSPGDDFAATHLAGGAAGAFSIAPGFRGVGLRTATASVYAEVTNDSRTPQAHDASASSFPLAADIALFVPLGAGVLKSPVVAAYCAGAANVAVFGLWG